MTWIILLLGVLITSSSNAQKLNMPGSVDEGSGTQSVELNTSSEDTPFSEESTAEVAVPSSYSTSGMYYNPTLGSHIRARYNTRSYGQERGNLDLGTMRVWDLGDSVSFFDGQVTLNEDSHVGYNLGLGYRWMDLPVFPFSADNQKIYGVSLWTDGQGAGGDNFFPQIGLGFEILGNRTDFRTNVYIPLGPESQDRDFVSGGDTVYSGNFLAEGLLGVRDTALTTIDTELAGRISDLEAWVFGGVYGYSGGDYEEVGGKVGLRGYATPDLALQIALTNDAVFDTNAVFSATWFIGRTRRENRPTGALRDRFREPVIRNDYIAMKSDSVAGAGDALLDANGDPIRIVHIDSTAAAGGDGTFENPFSTLAAAGGSGSEEGDILLAHAGSTFTADGVTLQDNQRLLGEGVVFDDGNALTTETNVDHTVTVSGGGTISLPETATDAFMMAAPTVTNTTETAVILADNNEVNNLVISGGAAGLMGNTFDPVGGTNGSGDQNLQNLQISGTTGNAIELTMARRLDDTNPSNATLEMDVNINNVELNSIGGAYGILLNANATVGPDDFRTDANTLAVNESTTIDGLSINGGTGVGIGLQNIENAAANVTASNFTYDGSGTGQGAIEVTNSSANITFDNTSSITNTGGVAIMVDGNSPTFNYNGSLNNSGGNSATVQNLTGGLAEFTFENGLTDTGTGIDVDNITGGTVRFLTSDSSNRNSISSGDDIAIRIRNIDDATSSVTFEDFDVTTNNADAIVADNTSSDGTLLLNDTTVTVTGTGRGVALDQDASTNLSTLINGLQVTTTSGTGVDATNANLTVAAGTDITPNTITTTTGTALALTDVAVNAGVTFDEVNVDGATNAIVLNDVGDGPVTIGTNAATDGGSGTIRTTGNAVVLTDVDDITLSDLIIDAPGSTAIASNNLDATDTTANNLTLNNIHTNSAAATPAPSVATALSVNQGASASDQNVTVNDSDFSDATGDAVSITGVSGTVDINNTTIDNAGSSAIVANGNSGTMTLNTVSADNATDAALSFTNIDGIVNGNTVTIEGGASDGVNIATSSGTFTFDPNSSITNQAGTALAVDGGDGQVTYNGMIENTVGRSVSIQNKTGGSVSFNPTASITDSGNGILVDNNSGGTYNLLATYDLDTTTNDAVTVTNNTGSNVTFAGLDIVTTTGRGFVASGGGTIGVNPGGSITTTTGTGFNMDGVTIANTGVTFDSVTTDGATNGILLNNLDGTGTVSINGGTIDNSTGNAIQVTSVNNLDVDGVTISDTTGNAIQATNVANFDVDNVTINGTTGGDAINLINDDANAMDVRIGNFLAGGTITGEAIDATHTGSGNFDLGINNSLNIGGEAVVAASGSGEFDLFVTNSNFTTGADVTGFDIDLTGSLTDVDISFINVDITTNNGIGLDLITSDDAKAVRFAMTNSSIINSSGTAATRAFNGIIGGTTTFDATFNTNVFDNTLAGDTFLLQSNSATVSIDANLTGNIATSGNITLDTTTGTFGVVDRDNANANNNGDLVFVPAIGNFNDINLGDVATPSD